MVGHRTHATGTLRSPFPTDPPTDPPRPARPHEPHVSTPSRPLENAETRRKFPRASKRNVGRLSPLVSSRLIFVFAIFVALFVSPRFVRVAPQVPAAPAPLRALATTGLIDVYKRINRDYYETRARRSSRVRLGEGSGEGSVAGSAGSLLDAAVASRGAGSRDPGAPRAHVGSADASAPRAEALASRRRSRPLSSSASGRLGSQPAEGSAARGRPRDPRFSADRENRDAFLNAAPRDLLHDRYAVGRVIGRGAFARVVVAYDIVADARVAIKITRRASRSHNARARKEIEILRVLGGGGGARGPDPRAAGASETSVGHPNVVAMLDHFVVAKGESEALFGAEASQTRESSANAPATDVDAADAETRETSDAAGRDAGLRCLVFELLSHSLYDVLRATSFRGVSLALVRKFSSQILHALRYLKSHGVVHLDLKPENVLLCSADRSRVKLVDFGSSRWRDESVGETYAQSRFYRAAEVLLGLPFSYPADVWSLGCIMVELHGGKPLFPGRDERHQLAKIAETLGPVPDDVFAAASAERRATHALARAAVRESFFDEARRTTKQKEKGEPNEPTFGDLGFVPKPHGSRPLRSVIAAASSAFEARRRERRAEKERRGSGVAADADAAATSLRALGLENDGDFFDASTSAASASFGSDAASTAEEATLTSVALFCDLVERLLTYEPELRAQPGSALEHPFFAEADPRGGFGGPKRAGGGADEADVDDEMLMYGLEGTDA